MKIDAKRGNNKKNVAVEWGCVELLDLSETRSRVCASLVSNRNDERVEFGLSESDIGDDDEPGVKELRLRMPEQAWVFAFYRCNWKR